MCGHEHDQILMFHLEKEYVRFLAAEDAVDMKQESVSHWMDHLFISLE